MTAYDEAPKKSWQRIFDRVKEKFLASDEKDISRLIGKCLG
jgi:hypothetical protein